MTNPKWNGTRFKPGRKKTGGRKAGVRNKKTRGITEAIQLAAELAGSDGAGKDGLVGYMKMLGIKYPASYCSLLGRILQHQLQTEHEEKREPVVEPSAEEIRAAQIRAEQIRGGWPHESYDDSRSMKPNPGYGVN
jgi:hypothetical protein